MFKIWNFDELTGFIIKVAIFNYLRAVILANINIALVASVVWLSLSFAYLSNGSTELLPFL